MIWLNLLKSVLPLSLAAKSFFFPPQKWIIYFFFGPVVSVCVLFSLYLDLEFGIFHLKATT